MGLELFKVTLERTFGLLDFEFVRELVIERIKFKYNLTQTL